MFSVERGGILQMALLLLSHAIAYDCYCYCNPLSEQSTERVASPLFNGGVAVASEVAASLSGICHPATLSLSLCMFVYVYGLGQKA